VEWEAQAKRGSRDPVPITVYAYENEEIRADGVLIDFPVSLLPDSTQGSRPLIRGTDCVAVVSRTDRAKLILSRLDVSLCINARNADIEIRDSTISHPPGSTKAAISIAGGVLVAERGVIKGKGRGDTAVVLSQSHAEFSETDITNFETALVSTDSTFEICNQTRFDNVGAGIVVESPSVGRRRLSSVGRDSEPCQQNMPARAAYSINVADLRISGLAGAKGRVGIEIKQGVDPRDIAIWKTDVLGFKHAINSWRPLPILAGLIRESSYGVVFARSLTEPPHLSEDYPWNSKIDLRVTLQGNSIDLATSGPLQLDAAGKKVPQCALWGTAAKDKQQLEEQVCSHVKVEAGRDSVSSTN